MADLRDLPEHSFRHPDGQCPACEEAGLPGPVVYGVWLPEGWYHDRVAGHIQRGLVQRFANRELAETVARDRLQALLADRAATRGRHAVTVTALARLIDRPAHYTAECVLDTAQLWLWTSDPRRRSRRWPDEALVFDHDQLAALTGMQLRRRVAADDARRTQRDHARRGAAVVGDLTTVLDGHVICWWKPAPDAPGALISVRDLGSSRPARRVLDDGSEEPVAGAPNGLILYGRMRVDRPTFDVAAKRTPEYAYLLQGAAEGRGVTTGR